MWRPYTNPHYVINTNILVATYWFVSYMIKAWGSPSGNSHFELVKNSLQFSIPIIWTFVSFMLLFFTTYSFILTNGLGHSYNKSMFQQTPLNFQGILLWEFPTDVRVSQLALAAVVVSTPSPINKSKSPTCTIMPAMFMTWLTATVMALPWAIVVVHGCSWISYI